MQSIVASAGLSDWSNFDRLDYAGTGLPGYELHGRTDLAGGHLYLSLRTDGLPISAGTTFWLNTDRDPTTGYQIWGEFGGANYNVDFGADADGLVRPYLYSGAAGECLVAETPLQHCFEPSRTAVEVAVPLGLLRVDRATNPTGAIDLLIDINDHLFLPVDYSGLIYMVLDPAELPCCTGDPRPAAIVYSETSAANYFDPVAYSDLLDLVHLRAQESGLSLTILGEHDLAHLDRVATFGTLIFPAFQNVSIADYRAIEQTLHTLSYRYGTALIAAGNFMTNDENGTPLPGNPYSRMRSLLNVTRTGGAKDVDVTLCAGAARHPLLQGIGFGEQIQVFPRIATQWFTGISTNYNEITSLATQIVDGHAHDAVLATRTGGQNAFFCIEAFLSIDRMLSGLADLINGATLPTLQTYTVRSRSGRDFLNIREISLGDGSFSISAQ